MLDYAFEARSLIAQIVKAVPIFSHIQPSKLSVSVSYARNQSLNGVWAQVYPMKYQNGHYSIRERKGNVFFLYKTDRLQLGQKEILYILYLMVPRFQNLSYRQKLETLFHELYHMSPEFDGKLRSIHPRYLFHGARAKLYDQNIRYWVRYYLNLKPTTKRAEFLKYSWKELNERYGDIRLDFIPEPQEKIRKLVYRRQLKKGKDRSRA